MKAKWPRGAIVGRDKYYPNEVFEMLEVLPRAAHRDGGWIAVRHLYKCSGCEGGHFLEEHHSSVEPLTPAAEEMLAIARCAP